MALTLPILSERSCISKLLPFSHQSSKRFQSVFALWMHWRSRTAMHQSCLTRLLTEKHFMTNAHSEWHI